MGKFLRKKVAKLPWIDLFAVSDALCGLMTGFHRDYL